MLYGMMQQNIRRSKEQGLRVFLGVTSKTKHII